MDFCLPAPLVVLRHECNPQSLYNPPKGCLLVTKKEGLFPPVPDTTLAAFSKAIIWKSVFQGDLSSLLLRRCCKDILKLSWVLIYPWGCRKSTVILGWLTPLPTRAGDGHALPRPQDVPRGAPDCAPHRCSVLPPCSLSFLFLYSLSLTLSSQTKSWLTHSTPFSRTYCASLRIHQVSDPLFYLIVFQLLEPACKSKTQSRSPFLLLVDRLEHGFPRQKERSGVFFSPNDTWLCFKYLNKKHTYPSLLKLVSCWKISSF